MEPDITPEESTPPDCTEPKSEDARVSSKPKVKKEKKEKSSKPADVKYRMTFLMGRPFQGEYHAKGESILVDELIFKAYGHRRKEFSFKAEK